MNNPKYIYVNDKIPKPLKTAKLDPEELKMTSFFSYKTEEAIKCHSSEYFIPFAKVFAQQLYGSGYYKTLGRLLKNGILEPKEIDKKPNGGPSFFGYGVCTSYKLSEDCIEAIRNNDYSKNLLKIPFVHSPKNPPETVHAICESDSVLVSKMAKAYEGMTVSASWQNYFSPDNPDAFYGGFIAGKHFVKQINKGQVNISFGKSGRVFHPRICMHRGIRPFMSNDGLDLVGIDGKAFHPFLLAKFLSEPSRQNYLDFLESNDIYSVFVDDAYDRDQIKRMFQIFLGGERLYGKAREIEEWYRQNYPEVIQWKQTVKNQGSTVQMELQTLEASIFVDGVFANIGCWCLPMHDGIDVLPDDADMAVAYCSEIIKKRLGYGINVQKKIG